MGSRVADARNRRLGFPSVTAVLPTAIVLIVSAAAAIAGGGPRNVAIVVNRASEESRVIGEYYRQARGIPPANVCYINCSTLESVSWQECETKIREPIIQFLARPEIKDEVDYLVLTKGVSLKADYGDATGPLSVCSVLLWPEDRYADANGDGKPDFKRNQITWYYPFPYGPVASPAAPVRAWSHRLFDSDIPGDIYDMNRQYYLVCRLDAFTVDQVKQMIDRSLCPALDGIFALDRNTATTGAYGWANNNLGDQNPSAFYDLVNQGFEVRFDAGQDFINNCRGLMGYYSWSGNDIKYTFTKYTSNVFVPGAIGDSYYSTSCRTFTDPGDPHNPLMADLFPLGLCGAGGYVSEPLVTTATYPHVVFERYTMGYNLAESYYMACPQAMWKTAIIGDPLLAPYATPPDVMIVVDGSPLSDVETIQAFAYDESGIKKVKFYIDNTVIGTDSELPFEIQLDTKLYPIGTHTLEVIAYENTGIETQGSATLDVVIDNPVSPVALIRDVLVYSDGQLVSVTGKVVTASSAEIGDSFYMEEPDRTSAIRVFGDLAVARGDVVHVLGAVVNLAGDRVITNAEVTVLSSGADVPDPLGMLLRDVGGSGVGSSTLPVGTGIGLRNTGLLIRVTGRVITTGTGEFCITDGSLPEPTKVLCAGVVPPEVGETVIVTGLSAAENASPVAKGTVRVRDANDIQVLP